MLRNRSWPAVSQKSVMQNQLRMTQLTGLCFSHNSHTGGKAQPTCSRTQTEFHLANLKHSRVKKLNQTGTFPYGLSCGLRWHWPSTKERPPVTRVCRTAGPRQAEVQGAVAISGILSLGMTRGNYLKLQKLLDTGI